VTDDAPHLSTVRYCADYTCTSLLEGKLEQGHPGSRRGTTKNSRSVQSVQNPQRRSSSLFFGSGSVQIPQAHSILLPWPGDALRPSWDASMLVCISRLPAACVYFALDRDLPSSTSIRPSRERMERMTKPRLIILQYGAPSDLTLDSRKI
jgi:hypothetical protein